MGAAFAAPAEGSMLAGFESLRERLRRGPLVMGVLNITPDSFSDGGLWLNAEAAVAHALDMADQGADVVDIGGESTRPGAPEVPVEEEWQRVGGVLAAVARLRPGLGLSIDTQKAEVALRALEAGACLVNDVSALGHDAAMAPLVAASGAGLCLMHRTAPPAESAWSPQQADLHGGAAIAGEVASFLAARLEAARRAGIAEAAVWLDPGLGFGKSVGENLALIRDLPRLAALGRPLLVGPSRKSFLGAALGGLPIEERIHGTVAACSVALWQGASVLRVHDVREADQARRIVTAIRAA